MKPRFLCLLSVSGAELRLHNSASGVLVRFTLEVGGQQSGEQLALVEQIGGPGLGLTGHLKICCASAAFGIPAQVIEPHIETYVLHAVHLIGGVTVAEMANKVVEMELRVPIEGDANTALAH